VSPSGLTVPFSVAPLIVTLLAPWVKADGFPARMFAVDAVEPVDAHRLPLPGVGG
jgi:hypothetical protein